jgi:DNA-binding LytR/AlgR family response regulator
MIIVAICDDEKGIGAKLESDLIDIFGKLNVKHEIDVYFTGEELCRKMESGAHYDLIFLDIEFARNEINGIEVGRLIREAYNNDVVSIVYISWERKYSLQLFDIRPLNFLIKPLDYEKLEQVVRTHLKIAGLWSRDFTYKIGHDTFKVRIKDIVYLESAGRKLILHLADGRKEEFYGTLKEVYQEQLQGFDFLFIHSAYVVNYDYIATLKYNELILFGSESVLPVSHRKRKEIGEAYYAILERRMG